VLTELFIAELNEGMYIHCDSSFPEERCPFRAGQIKTALEPEWDERRRVLFRAAAAAARETGRALMAHIEKGADPLALAAFLDGEGVPAGRIIFCHMDRSVDDPAVHKEICRRGITLEYDTIARYKYHGDEKEAAIIRELLESGYEKRLLLSLDVTRARLKSYGGKPGLDFILKTFIPFLSDRGVSEKQIRLFFIDNPARIFSPPADK
jgi:phosphotriesterase-related protein